MTARADPPGEEPPRPDGAFEVPMFPLGTVLMPGGAIPLHVFEPRYRALVRRCVDADEPFGIVLIERGSEVGGGEVRTDVGCLARIAEHEELPDGRWAIIAVGERRVRVEQWLPDGPYPRALAAEWPDTDDVVTPERRAEMGRRTLRLMAIAAEAGYQVPKLDLSDTDDLNDTEFSYRLAASLPVGALDRQTLLRAPHAPARLDVLEDVLAGVELVVMAAIADAGDDLEPPEDPEAGAGSNPDGDEGPPTN